MDGPPSTEVKKEKIFFNTIIIEHFDFASEGQEAQISSCIFGKSTLLILWMLQ